MQYWNDIYIEIAERITGLRKRGEKEKKEDLAFIKNPQDGDAYKVTNEDGQIFRYTVSKNEYGEVISAEWVNTGRVSFAGKLPEIQWVDLWHEQVSFLTSELPFPTPAIFIGFTTLDIDDRGGLVQDCNTQIDMYLFFETFSDTYGGSYNRDRALDYLQSLTRLHALFHGKSGKNFSAMRRVDMRREESGGAGNLYRISFQCVATDYAAQYMFVETQNPTATLEIERAKVAPGESDTPMYDV